MSQTTEGCATLPRSPRRRAQRYTRAGLVLVATVVAVTALGNTGLFLLHQRLTSRSLVSTAQGSSHHVTRAVSAGGRGVLAATVADRLELLAGGRATHRRRMHFLIGALAASPARGTYYTGTSDGSVVEWSAATSAALRTWRVNGQVVGLSAPAAGGVVVAYGFGASGANYYVGYYPDGASHPAYNAHATFTISALAAGSDEIVYGTLVSQVEAISLATGKRKWEHTVDQPVSALLMLPGSGKVLVGSQGGTLTLLSRRGQSLGSVKVGQYPLVSLAYDRSTRTYLAGDSHGDVSVLGERGQLLTSRRVGTSAIVALLPSGQGRMTVVPADGPWSDLDLDAVPGSIQAARLTGWWWGANAALLVALLASLVTAVRSWSRALVGGIKRCWKGRLGYALVLPAIVMILVFSYYPAVSAIGYSLTDFSLSKTATEFVGLQNYVQIIVQDFYFRTGLLNMLIITVTSFLKTVTMPLLAAELVFWLRNRRHQYLFRTLFVLPAVVPGIVLTLLWKQVYDPNTGLLNELLGSVGLSRLQTAWLGNSATAIWAIVGVGFPYISAFSFLILLGGLININGDYFDAAKVDGANVWQRFTRVDVPLLLSQFRILVFFAVTGAIEGFSSIFILTSGGPGFSTYVPALEMYLRISDGDFGYASAVGLILCVIVLAATVVIMRVRRQTTESA